MSVAYADVLPRQLFCNSTRGDTGNIEAQRGGAMTDLIRSSDAIYSGICLREHLKHRARKLRLISANGLCCGYQRCAPGRGSSGIDRMSEFFQVPHCRIHPGDVLVNVGSNLEFGRRCVRHKIFTERRQRVQRFTAAPKKSHMRRKNLVAGADQEIALESLNINRAMRAVMNGIDKDFSADGVCPFRDLVNIQNGSYGV